MSDLSQGDGWWLASDGKWYAPELHPEYVPAATLAPPTVDPAVSPMDEVAPASRRPLILAMVALVLVCGLGFIGWRLLSAGSSTGADSPQAAVQQLIDSLSEADPVGLVEIVDPYEIDTFYGSFVPFIETFEDAVDLIEDEALAAGLDQEEIVDAYGRLFETLDINVTGSDGESPSYTVEELDDDGRIARVIFDSIQISINNAAEPDRALIFAGGGEVGAFDAAALDGASLALTTVNDDIIVTATAPDGEETREVLDDAPLQLVTVERDGRWYLSIGYSIGDLAIEVSDLATRPDYGRGFELAASGDGGSDTAGNAVRDFAEALETLDYQRMIDLADPAGLPYLHDYFPLVDAEISQDELREAREEFELRITELELREELWNDRVFVGIERVAADVDGGTVTVDLATQCVRAVSRAGEVTENCLEELLDSEFGDEPISEDSDVLASELIPDSYGLVTIERNGRFYIDPMGTLGWYYAQIGVVLADVFEGGFNRAAADSDIDTSEITLVVTEGPILRAGSVTAPSLDGGAGVAISLKDARLASAGYALIEVSVDEAAAANTRLVGFDSVSSPTWAIVTDEERGEGPILPAVVAATDSTVTVELIDKPLVLEGLSGVTGEFDADGTPFIVELDFGGDYVVEGADWARLPEPSSVSVMPLDGGSKSADEFVRSTQQIVVWGEPGDRFAIDPLVVEAPVAVIEDTDPRLADSVIVDIFTAHMAEAGLRYGYEVSGGYFDGCGPSDPDVETVIFGSGSRQALVTVYPSVDRATAAFDALRQVASPCEEFGGLNVLSNDSPTPEEVVITFSYDPEDPPDQERYFLRGRAIVAAVGVDPVDFAEISALVESFDY